MPVRTVVPLRPLAAVLVCCGIAVCAPPARAAWPHDPAVNVPVCTAASNQFSPVIASDGAGGAIMAWHDIRSLTNYDIYTQRVSASGVAQWTTDGVAVAALSGDQINPVVVSDGAGGAIIAWQDNRGGNFDVYAQRLNAAGVPQWTANGVAVCTAALDQQLPKIASDGAGGAIVAWVDNRNGNTDIYAQRISAAGAPLWSANGIPLCTAANTQTNEAIVADGAGGAVVVWQDLRGGATYDIYAQRVTGGANVLWNANGVSVCSAANNQNVPALIADGSGGAIVTWYDFRTGGNPDIYVQHINALGSQQWGLDGAPVCVDPGVQQFPAIASDGSGGAVVAWQDGRNGSGDIYAQRMSAGGAAQWTTDGVPVCTAANNQANTVVVPDGSGGAIVAWYDQRSVIANDIYAQRLNAAGVAQWTANGVPISTANADQINPALVADGAGGAIAAWQDARNSGAPDIYAQRVEHFGYLGNPEPVSAGVHDVPNDQGGRVKVAFYPSWLDGVSDPNLAAYDIYRSAPGSVARAAVRAGAHALAGFGQAPPTTGRAFVLPDGVSLYAWEFVGTVNPTHFLSAYGYIAATTGDSIGGSNPLTAFMIVARNASGSMYWLSAPDSGYSVDNLAPVAPAPFTGAYSAGATHLHWGANSETDLAGYRVYRGSSSSFIPGPADLIASPADTGYVDVGAAGSWYKLSAVDAHGNESPFATLGPGGTTGAPGAGGPALWLSAPNPVPASGGAIRFSLAHAGRAALALYDASGRRVRTLVEGALAAGLHEAPLALRDLPGGLYFARLATPDGTRVARVAVLR
ncbi:MAG TPA: hypothetical protein VFK69_13630 [Candidatus Eisenbacteria bacterium]|nr:hypothetical protein [Candidatus Eisenbacteria bacterium]